MGKNLYTVLRQMSSTKSLTQSQVDGTQAILDYALKEKKLPLSQIAYVLATAWHETAERMQPILETTCKTVDDAIDALDRAYRSGRLPWVSSRYWAKDSDGKSWLGRGFVQITHKVNYKRVGDFLKQDLVNNPDKALDLNVAVKILVDGMVEGLFTARKLSDYIKGDKTDYVGARKIINGTDRADMVAKYASKILIGLKSDYEV